MSVWFYHLSYPANQGIQNRPSFDVKGYGCQAVQSTASFNVKGMSYQADQGMQK